MFNIVLRVYYKLQPWLYSTFLSSQAFHIEKVTCDQQDLSTSDFLWIEENDDAKYRDGKFEIIEATRIGIDSAPEGSRKDLFRFYIQDNLCVSTAKPSQILKKLTAAAESQRLTEGTGAHSDQKWVSDSYDFWLLH